MKQHCHGKYKAILTLFIFFISIYFASLVPLETSGKVQKTEKVDNNNIQQTENELSSNYNQPVNTRADPDISVDGISYQGGIPGWEITQAGKVTNYSIGIVGELTHFGADITNNRAEAVEDVEIYFEIWTNNTTAQFQVKEVYNTTETVANIAGGATVNVQFTFKFIFAFLYNITASTQVPGDTDPTNNAFSLFGWVNKWADDCENGEGLWTHQPTLGNDDDWHITDTPRDPNGDHTAQNAWYHGEDGNPDRYRNGASMELRSPIIDLANFRIAGAGDAADFSYPLSYAYKIVGQTNTGGQGDVMFTDEVTDDGFISTDHIFSQSGQEPSGYMGNFPNWISTTWYSDLNGNGQVDPDEPQGIGVPMGLTMWDGTSSVRDFGKLQFRFTFSSDATNNNIGFYIDDIIVWGLENYVEDITAPPQIENVRISDLPNDNGGALILDWDKCIWWDFDHYDVYGSETPIYNVSGMTPLISNIDEGGNTSHVIESLDGAGLQDDTPYYFAITVTDIWGNVNLEVINGSGKCFNNPPLCVDGVDGQDVPGDEGFELELTWNPNNSPDLESYNLYQATNHFNSVNGATKIASNLTQTNYIVTNLTNNLEYYFAVTSVDDSSEHLENTSISSQNRIGPIIPLDNLAPDNITGIRVWDTPGDDGGSLEVSWDEYSGPDFDHYKIYIDDQKIHDVSTLGVAEKPYVLSNHTTLTSINSNPLEEGNEYFVAVVAVDSSGNQQNRVASSPSSRNFENIPPLPLDGIFVYDTPIQETWADIDGGAITVEWLFFTTFGFDHYNVYIANHSIETVQGMTPEKIINDGATQSTILTSKDGKRLVNSMPLAGILQEYWVAVTAVDERGNENYMVNCAGPVTCMENYPPDTLGIRNAYDTPDDGGDSITLEFKKGDEDDIYLYEVYIKESEFYSIKRETPEKVIYASELDGESIFSTTITTINGEKLQNGRNYYLAISAVDGTGNQNHIVEPFGPVQCVEEIPPERVKDLFAQDRPDDGGGVIEVQWGGSDEADFAYYQLYIFEHNAVQLLPSHVPFIVYPEQPDPFCSQIRSRDGNSFEVDRCQVTKMKNNEKYWIAVLAYDTSGNTHKTFECFGPIVPKKNLFPYLALSEEMVEVQTIKSDELLSLEVYLENPLDDEYHFVWYFNDIIDEKYSSSKYKRMMKENYIGNTLRVKVVLLGENEELFDTYTWNITVKGTNIATDVENEEWWSMGETNRPMIAGTILLLFIIIVVTLAIIMRRKKKELMPRHMEMDDTEEFELTEDMEEVKKFQDGTTLTTSRLPPPPSDSPPMKERNTGMGEIIAPTELSSTRPVGKRAELDKEGKIMCKIVRTRIRQKKLHIRDESVVESTEKKSIDNDEEENITIEEYHQKPLLDVGHTETEVNIGGPVEEKSMELSFKRPGDYVPKPPKPEIETGVTPVATTVCCYNCESLVEVFETERPITIRCPICNTESILQ